MKFIVFKQEYYFSMKKSITFYLFSGISSQYELEYVLYRYSLPGNLLVIRNNCSLICLCINIHHP